MARDFNLEGFLENVKSMAKDAQTQSRISFDPALMNDKENCSHRAYLAELRGVTKDLNNLYKRLSRDKNLLGLQDRETIQKYVLSKIDEHIETDYVRHNLATMISDAA